MKIKEVSELTGLSDRTIRYYFEQKLIFPEYSENYLGRKKFMFSQRDIDTLNRIAILRKFDFTIEEIREIINDANTSSAIILNVKNRIIQASLDYKDKLSALSKLDCEKSYTFEQLAKELSHLMADVSQTEENIKTDIAKTAFSIIKTAVVFVVVWMPFFVCLISLISGLITYNYPVFDPIMIVLTLFSFSPSFSVLVFSKANIKRKNMVISLLLIICVLISPFCFVFSSLIVTKSETDNFEYYRDFDTECLANRDNFFQQLLPTWPHYFENKKQPDGSYVTEYLDAHYYYQYIRRLDYTYDIFAEWPLSQDDFYNEVNRATELFNSVAENNNNFVELKRGSYNCLILYHGQQPFSKATNNYDYIIFAYNEADKTVRYICCASLENGVDQPYYLTLDW